MTESTVKTAGMPELSIIVPAYNAEPFIATAIQSFLNQGVDWAEMIIVDDGSRDNTVSQCTPYISDKVRYFRTENLGAGHARNYGIDRARGNWIGFLDSDDLLTEGVLNRIYPPPEFYTVKKISTTSAPFAAIWR